MRTPKFGRGDTIKLLPETPYPRATGSLFVIRNIFAFADLNATVRDNLNACMSVDEETPVYYCSDEINYNVFVPESYLKGKWFLKRNVPMVEPASQNDKLYLRVAMIAEASRQSGHYQHHSRRREEDE